MREHLQKTTDIIATIEKVLIIILLPVMSITILLNTLARITGLFTDQLIWAEEFARYLMIGMAFIGAALVMQDNGHYKMTAIVDALPDKLSLCMKRFSYLLTIVFMILLAKIGIDCCLKIAAMGQTSPTLKLPMWIPYASIPVGMILGVIQTILREAIQIIDSRKKEDKV